MTTIEGTVERITYHNQDNGYAVLRFLPYGEKDIITAVGRFLAVDVGESFILHGDWYSHPEYGRQFKVEEYQLILPKSELGIERYLGSGMIRGIGPVTAKKIVDKFGLDTLEVIEQQPKKLKEVEGIGDARVRMIQESFAAQKEIRNVMVFLQGYQISPTYAVKIYKHFGDAAIAKVKQDPYCLAWEITGIGFKTADRIAQNMGIGSDDPKRAQAALLYILDTAMEDGHVFLEEQELIARAEQELQIPKEIAIKAVRELQTRRELVKYAYEEGVAVYKPLMLHAEKGIAARLLALAQSRIDPQIPSSQLEILVAQAEKSEGITLAEQQKQAVMSALNSGVLVITGGPGTGKTTIVKVILALLKDKKVALTSPTGRAAKRLKETTGKDAKTIHRLLEFGLDEETGRFRFQRNEQNPLHFDVVVVDEASMIDVLLMNNLLKAITPPARLILVGDVDQLPSVGPGNVLKDIIGSQVVDVVRLTQIFRQKRTSHIIQNAHRINDGSMPYLGNSGDFFFTYKEDPEQVVETVKSLVSKRLPKYLNCHPIRDIQVISPMRRTITGVDNLNHQLQGTLNPPTEHALELANGQFRFRKGDKVMQIRNNYEALVFNGDIGRVRHVDPEERLLKILFPTEEGYKEVTYEDSDLDQIVLAYAVTVHKSQGSEYPVVVMPVTTQHFIMLQRNLLYTAVTRAKRMVVLVGTKKAIAIAVKNNKIEIRNSLLKDFLKGEAKQLA
ncbi:MAG: ATP-dependent RecD-like DNA helicase, partial [Limnochordia bacterium]|nr:ATP-dependent RecD-like DNA helicase [Limnochordia bacterium]